MNKQTMQGNGDAGQTLAPVSVLADLVRAYQREVNPADDWMQTAMTKENFDDVTKEYRAAKEWLSANDQAEPLPPDSEHGRH